MLVNAKRSTGLFIVFIVVLIAAGFGPHAAEAAPSIAFAWAKKMGGASYERGERLAVDASGNVYSTGNFSSSTVDFDPGAGTYNLTCSGHADAFVSKLNANGNFLWAKKIGGVEDDFGIGIAVDGSRNVYVAGDFQGTVDFDPGAGIYNLTSAGSYDMFISKLDTNGNFIWAKAMGGISNDQVEGLAIDAAGMVHITGGFSDTVDFDPGAGVSNLTSAGSEDIFVAKYDPNGSFVWAKGMSGTGLFEGGSELALDGSGNVYSIGTFNGTVDFDPGAGVYNLNTAGNADIFISKLDSNGNFVWAKGMGGGSGDMGSDIRIDKNGNVFSTGSFNNTVDFDPGAGTYNLTSAGYWDNYVSKLDTNGNFVWAKAMGGTLTDNSYGLALDAGGNVYTTGGFASTVDFDPGPGTYNVTSSASVDIFISKLDTDGNFVWVKQMPGTGIQYGMSIFVDQIGNVYSIGDNLGVTDFDPGAGTYNLSTSGYNDIYLSKLAVVPTFSDVSTGYWSWSFIERLYAAGITGGCGTSPLMYCPEGLVTRAQMAIFLERGINGSSYSPPAVGGSTGFTDVPVDHWAAAWIKQFALDGITAGCGQNTFCPEGAVTRSQMAVFLLKAKHGVNYSPPDVGAGTGFTDVPPNYWSAAWIKQLAAEGITGGCGGGNYCPEAPVTRAQMAVFLVKTFDLP